MRYFRLLSRCAILVVAMLAVASLTGKGWDGYSLRALTSASMAPTLPPGSLVLIRKVEQDAYKVGDVAAVYVPERREAIVHRIVWLGRTPGGALAVRTKGDGNANGDPWTLSRGALTGRMVGSVPYLGTFFLLLHGWYGFLAVAALSGWFLVRPALLGLFTN